MEKYYVKYDEIKERGFVVDAFLPTNPDLPTYGLTVSLAWPLPKGLKDAYEKLQEELSQFGDDVYVYPYEKTHVTVLTLLNFKKYQNPNAQQIEEIEKLIPQIASTISNVLQKDVFKKLKPFKIEIESPVLASAAAFLPISNPTGEIFLLRNEIAPIMEKEFSLQVEYNKEFVHSTIMRFKKVPQDKEKFIAKFESIAKRNRIGEAVINEFYLTSETKPYMRGGEKKQIFRLQ